MLGYSRAENENLKATVPLVIITWSVMGNSKREKELASHNLFLFFF